MENRRINPSITDIAKSKTNLAKKVHDVLYDGPISRRMAATRVGFPDQTFMVTQFIDVLLKSGKAQIVDKIRCKRSNKLVQGITTNPKYFKKIYTNQLRLF